MSDSMIVQTIATDVLISETTREDLVIEQVGTSGPQGVPGGTGGRGPQGDVGPQGEPGSPGGAQGVQGAPGEVGSQGPQGTQGHQGYQGDAITGNDGQPRWSGYGSPGLIIGAEPGDEYLDKSTGNIYTLQ